ncbi:MAG: tripartite tricarboxylate transporter substrate binding protein [Thermodesulfobacteriota bacterium]|nr:tripartite tricarboxylate transporter substrate binding protein [Thermodesulfobacteriota bacterium]
MKTARTWSFALVLILALLGGKVMAASIADYPSQPITLIVATSAGGGYDLGARNIARFLPKYLPKKVDVIVDNMPGAGQLIAIHALYAAKPDGYTLLACNALTALLAAATRPERVKFDPVKFQYLGMWQDDTRSIGVSNALKVNTWQELVARSKKSPILVGTGGKGTGMHVDPLMMETVSGDLKLRYIHYDGSAQVTPAMGRGEIEMQVAMVGTIAELKEIKIGRLFCVLDKRRHEEAPDVPTALEVGMPESQLDRLMENPFYGVNRVIAAPPGMDPRMVALLRDAIWKTFQDPDYLAQLKRLKGDNNPMRGERYQEILMKKMKEAQGNKELLEKLKF